MTLEHRGPNVGDQLQGICIEGPLPRGKQNGGHADAVRNRNQAGARTGDRRCKKTGDLFGSAQSDDGVTARRDAVEGCRVRQCEASFGRQFEATRAAQSALSAHNSK
jgi:hypothetical protein